MPSSFPLMVVRDLLWLVLTGGSPVYLAPMQTEVHLIKQLSGSPSPKSERLGWQLKGRGALLAVLPARLSREELRRVLPTLAHDHFACELHARARARPHRPRVSAEAPRRAAQSAHRGADHDDAARRRRDERLSTWVRPPRHARHSHATHHTPQRMRRGAAISSPPRPLGLASQVL